MPIQLEVLFEIDGERFLGTASDISLGGMFIETDEPPPEGTEIVVQCELDDHILRTLARVRCSHSQHGCGVGFLALEEVSRRALERAIERQHALLEEAERLLSG